MFGVVEGEKEEGSREERRFEPDHRSSLGSAAFEYEYFLLQLRNIQQLIQHHIHCEATYSLAQHRLYSSIEHRTLH
jgi:hypothetical protein